MTVGYNATNAANPILAGLLKATNWTAPVANYAELHTADPGAAGTTSVSVGSTTRVVMTWGTPSAGVSALGATFPSWTNGGTSETLTHIAVWSAATGGNFLYSIALTASQAWASGNTFALSSGSVTISPIAA